MLKYLNLVAAIVVVGATTMTMAGGMDYAIITSHTIADTAHPTNAWCGSDKARKVQVQLEYASALEWFYSDEDWEGDVRSAKKYGWRESWPCGGC